MTVPVAEGLKVMLGVRVGSGVQVGCCVGVALRMGDGVKVCVAGAADSMITFKVRVRSGALVFSGDVSFGRATTTNTPIDIIRHRQAITQ